MVSRSSGLKLLISFFVVFSALLGVLSLTQTAHADGAAGPFLSQKLRDRVADYQQLTYTLSCIPTETMADKDVFGTGNGLNNVGAEDMVFASKTELNDWKVIDQNVFGASNNRGDMFDHEILTCDDQNEWGFRWPFVQFGRPDLVEVFCSTSGVYNSQTGGLGKTVNGGSDKAACQAGTKFGGSYFVAKQGTNLRKAVSDELSKKSDRAKEAANGLSPAEKYIQYWLTFQKACGVTLTSEYPKNGDPAGGDGSIYKVAVVNQNGDIVYYVGNTGGKSTDGKKVKLDASDQAYPGSTTCGQLAIGLRDLAPKYSAYLKGPGKNDAGVEGTGIPEDTDIYHPKDDGDNATQCNIPKTGWILCPVLDTMANIADQAFGFLSDNFLTVDTGLFNEGSGTHAAWEKFRDIANIAFVIAVFIVVYSQLTGAGISNYGIKKLLPKIVVAAILVNLSYYICEIAVDLSNILGNTLKSFFDNIQIPLPTGVDKSGWSNGGLSWQTILGAVVVGAAITAAIWLSLGALIPILIASIIAMFMILFILLARKALIVLLIALAPLAFVAYLLPNTEQWYKRWQKTFVQLLMVFPIIAIVFGASGLASKIVQSAAYSSDSTLMKIIAAGIAVIPLFVVPGLLKRSVDAAGNIGAKINSVGNKVGGFAGKKTSDRFDQSAIMKGRKFRREERGRVRDRKFAERTAQGSRLARGFGGITPGGRAANDRMALRAAADADKHTEQDIAEASTFLTGQGITNDQWQQAALSGAYSVTDANGNTTSVKVSEAARRAAIRKQASSGNHEYVQQLVDQAGSLDGASRRDLASSIASSSNKPTWASQGALNDIAGTSGNTVKTTDEYIGKAIEAGAYSAEKIATGDKDELAAVADHAAIGFAAGTLSQEAAQQLINSSHEAKTDPILSKKISKNRNQIDALQIHAAAPRDTDGGAL